MAGPAAVETMRTLDIFPKTNRHGAGYTLLELLVVVSIIGLMAGLALPRLSGMYDSLKWAGQRDEVFRRIGNLGYEAYMAARDFELDRYPPEKGEGLLTLPEGWKIETEAPVRYGQDGVCFGGVLYLTYKERRIKVLVKPPRGKPVAAQG
jgi:general secretion pathway protein G